jgi:predicted  nucleic acid-binding Zn-ribbon protein
LTQASNWYIRRLEKGADKREKKIQKLREKIADAEHRYEAGKITRAKYAMKKADLEAKIRQLSARVNTFRGAIGKERHRLSKEGE